MVAAQRHRGPDDEGIAEVSQSPLVVVGQARLSIIDVSPEGHQPMVDPDTGNVIVFNGEIYNFKQLREELSGFGCAFRTHSDTEVLLKAYARWGKACCSRLRGIFAFAIWDKQSRQLFIARDQLGVKPFYYRRQADGFIFASEVRAILRAGGADARVDPMGLSSYFAYGSVQEPFTLIAGIRSLPPAHCGFVSEGGVTFERYWSPALWSEGRLEQAASKEAAYSEVAETLREAVSLQMIADVPLGAFLSGGVDSSAIVSLMRQVCQGRLKTFSIVFDHPRFDERRYAAQVARQNGTEHVELELTGDLAKANLGVALSAFDLPSMDGLNTWFVSKLVKEAGLTVALSGVGGDELFVGYGGFEKPLSMSAWQKRLRGFPPFLGRLISAHAGSEKVRKFGQLMGYPLPAYFLSRQVFSSAQAAALLQADILRDGSGWEALAFETAIADAKGFDEVDQISWYEMSSYMLSTLLRDTDQMSMAHSLEVRVPLIDHRVVEKMLALPSRWKKEPSTPKPVLVQAAGEGLPSECVHRPKQGFVLPFEEWFKGAMKNDVEAFCQDGGCAIFNKHGLRILWQQYQAGNVMWSRIWGLFVLNRWLAGNGVEVR